MSELKTLKQLWDEQGGPFWARNPIGSAFYCVAIAPGNNQAIGWDIDGESATEGDAIINWTLCPDPTKHLEPLRVWRSNITGNVYFRSEHDSEFETDITTDLARALLPEIKRLMEDE